MDFKAKMIWNSFESNNWKKKKGSEFRNFRAKKPKQVTKQRRPERERPASPGTACNGDQCHHSFHKQSNLHWSNPDTFGMR